MVTIVKHQLTSVTVTLSATFVYDGDGNRVKSTIGTITTAFVGNHTEWEVASSSLTRYYYAGSTRVAMRKNNTVYYVLGDHLGSTSVTTDQNGQNPAKQLYAPWGEVRYSSGSLQTKYTYTGQYSNVGDFGLMYYNARWYDSALSRWTQPDSIVPDPYNPMDWDKFTYARNNPVNNIDPTGHMVVSDTRENGCSGFGPACIMDMYYAESGDSEGLHDSLEAFIRRNPEYDPTQDTELTSTGQFIVATAKTRIGMENGSFWDFVAFGIMAGFGTYTTGFAPFEFNPGQNKGLSNQQRDILGDPDCLGCRLTGLS